jgi:hypothetical protein
MSKCWSLIHSVKLKNLCYILKYIYHILKKSIPYTKKIHQHTKIYRIKFKKNIYHILIKSIHILKFIVLNLKKNIYHILKNELSFSRRC